MNFYTQYPRKSFFLFFLFFYFYSSFTRAEFFITFDDDGCVSYTIKTKNVSFTAKDKKVPNDGISIPAGKNKFFFKVKFSKDEGFYKLKQLQPIPSEEDVKFRIPENFLVKFKGEMKCHSLTVAATYNNQDKGTFINNGKITFVDTDTLGITNKERFNQKVKKYGLHIQDNLTIENNNVVTFDREILLSLQQGSLINNKNIYFQKKGRIVSITNIGGLGDPLVFSKKESPSLINNGYIEGSEELALFAKCFISEKGRIHAKQIHLGWNGQGGNLSFASDIEKDIPLTKPERKYPIIDIVRISNDLKQKYALDVPALGEESACAFYEDFLKQKSFSHKSNNQENGIDIIAYDDREARLIVHESKNHKGNSFTLAKNQMTKTWIYGHLFRMYQDSLKENVRLLQTESRALPEDQHQHIKSALSLILKENYLKDLETLEQWVSGDEPEEKDDFVEIINEITGKKISTMTLENYQSYFKDLTIFARGNSIFHCTFPNLKDCGFDNSFTDPTYFIRRDLRSQFNKKGRPPNPNG